MRFQLVLVVIAMAVVALTQANTVIVPVNLNPRIEGGGSNFGLRSVADNTEQPTPVRAKRQWGMGGGMGGGGDTARQWRRYERCQNGMACNYDWDTGRYHRTGMGGGGMGMGGWGRK